DREQVRPHVHLVLCLGARLLDRARLDDRQQSLGVTAGTGARRRGRGHRGCRGASTARGGGRCGRAAVATRERGLAPTRPLEQVRGNAALVLGDLVAGCRGCGGCRSFFGGRGFVGCGRFGRGLVTLVAFDGQAERLAPFLAPLEQVFRNLSHAATTS